MWLTWTYAVMTVAFAHHNLNGQFMLTQGNQPECKKKQKPDGQWWFDLDPMTQELLYIGDI